MLFAVIVLLVLLTVLGLGPPQSAADGSGGTAESTASSPSTLPPQTSESRKGTAPLAADAESVYIQLNCEGEGCAEVIAPLGFGRAAGDVGGACEGVASPTVSQPERGRQAPTDCTQRLAPTSR